MKKEMGRKLLMGMDVVVMITAWLLTGAMAGWFTGQTREDETGISIDQTAELAQETYHTTTDCELYSASLELKMKEIEDTYSEEWIKPMRSTYVEAGNKTYVIPTLETNEFGERFIYLRNVSMGMLNDDFYIYH